MHANEIYNPRLIITEHFDKIKNQLDIKVETIFDACREINNVKRDEINMTRDKQLKKIEEIERNNLSLYSVESNKAKFVFMHIN